MRHNIEYGYARMGSQDKDAEIQLMSLSEAGIPRDNLFMDRASEKEKYRQMTGRIKSGDVLVIKNLRQLGYSYREMLNEWDSLTNKLGVRVRVLDIPLLDTSLDKEEIDGSFVSELAEQFLAFAAQREQAHIKYRQTEGIAHAKLQGKHLGRPRIPKPAMFDEIYDRWRAGNLSAEEAMSRLNLKRSTFERFVKERKEELKKELEQKAS